MRNVPFIHFSGFSNDMLGHTLDISDNQIVACGGIGQVTFPNQM